MISCGITKPLIGCLISVVLSAFINGIVISVRESALKSIFKFTDRVIRMRTLEEKQISNPGKDFETLHSFDNQTNERLNNFYILWYSTYFIAGIIGAILSGYLADRIGRKRSLLWNNGFIFMAIFFIAFSARFGSYEMVIIGQILFGINSGMNACLAPIYLTEVSPVRTRGIFGSAYIVSTSFAILTTHTLIVCFEFENWIYMFSSAIIPAFLILIVLNECPESPKYSYVLKGDQNRAQNALQKLRENSEINEELYELKVEYQAIERNSKFEFRYIWTDSKIRNALFISIIVIMSRHMTGITTVMSFSDAIYDRVGLSNKAKSYISIAVLAIGFKTSLIFMFFVERIGRRTLLLIGLLGMFGAQVFLAFCLILRDSLEILNYLNIITFFLYIILYSIGPNFIPHFYFTELFRTDSRSMGSTISIISLYSVNLIVYLCFPPIQTNSSYLLAFLFATFNLILWVVIYKKVPETKGKTIEEIIYEL